jgi:hypothetical protein
MERSDVQRMADGVLRDYAVPMKVATIVPADSGWTIGFAGNFPGSPDVHVVLRCDRNSAHHVRESLKRSLALTD